MTERPNPTPARDEEAAQRRSSVRLSTVYSGRVSQFGKAYPCVVSDVSEGGAKVKIKDPKHYDALSMKQAVQLVFERLSDYKALNGDIAWVRPNEHVIGLTFTDTELRRRVVLKKLMPNRWRIANEQVSRDDTNSSDTETKE